MNIRRSVMLLLAAGCAPGLGSFPAYAQAQTSPEQIAAVRADFNPLLDEFQDLARALEPLNPRIHEQLDALAQARVHLDGLADVDLAGVAEAVQRNPEVWNAPTAIREALEAPRRSGHARTPGEPAADLRTCSTDAEGTCDNCPASPFLIQDVYIAKGIALVLEAVFEPIPDTLDIPLIFVTLSVPHPAKVIVGILYFAAETIALSFEATYDINSECLD